MSASEAEAEAPAVGVYVHVPFCARRCPYCDFSVVIASQPPIDAYHDALEAEFRGRATELDGRPLRTVYFGGGTPSRSGAAALIRTLDVLLTDSDRSPEEVTLEVNPEDSADLDFAALKAAGFDRVSLGAQSFDCQTLELLGRQHRGLDVTNAVDAARAAGFTALSIDLIHGVPEQPEKRLASDLSRIVDLGIDHVSVYELTFEPGTSFDRRRVRGEMGPLEEDRLADETAQIEEALGAAGILRYEVSNYARPGAEAIHNSAYWRGDEYLGIGIGAHSLRVSSRGAIRRQNTRAIRKYIADPMAGATLETLADHEFLSELILTGTRTVAGVDLAALFRTFPAHATTLSDLVKRWAEAGLIGRDGDRVFPTTRGLALADSIAGDAIEALSSGETAV